MFEQQKRRKVQLSPYQEQLKGIFDACLDAMEELDNPTMGHQCTGLFNQLPAKRDYADYYVLIKNPIVRRLAVLLGMR